MEPGILDGRPQKASLRSWYLLCGLKEIKTHKVFCCSPSICWVHRNSCQCEVRFPWWVSRKSSAEQCCLFPEVQCQFHGIVKSRLALLEYGEWGARWEERVSRHRREDGNGGGNHRCSERMLTSEYRVQRRPGTPFAHRNQPVSPCLLCPPPVVWFLS